MSSDLSTPAVPSTPPAKPRRFQFGLKTLLLGMTVGGAVLGVVGLLIERGIEVSRTEQAKNNLRQMAIALHNHESVFRSFPAPASLDAAGKPLLSWRVQILPFIEEDLLYRQFHLDEPWDSPHNSKLIARMPKVYESPNSRRGVKKLPAGMTCYLAPIGPDTVFPGATGLPITSITDGTSNTIMLVEAAPEQAVIWTKPDDWEFDPQQPKAGLVGQRRGGFLASLSDGYVQLIPETVSEETLRRLFNRHDGLPVYREQFAP